MKTMGEKWRKKIPKCCPAYFDSVHLVDLGVLPELDVLQHKGPDVVAEPVRVQLLSSRNIGTQFQTF